MTDTAIVPEVRPAAAGKAEFGSAFVPVQTRSERVRSFDPSDFGVITGREVDWKFAPVARMSAVLEDRASDAGALDVTVDEREGAATGVLASGVAPRGEVFVPEDVPSAIASNNSAEALHLKILPDAELPEPLFVRAVGASAASRANSHLVIEAMPHSQATVVIEHTGAVQLAQNVEIIVRDGARLTVIALHEWDDEAVHVGAHQAAVAKDGHLRHVLVSLGGSIVRVNPSVRLAGPGADAEMYGLYFADAGQHLEQQVFVHHDAPQTRSRVNYKGVLRGTAAHTVWIGDVLIARSAPGTDSYEQNRNLMLTDGTRADSIPNLEIETGDIAGAGHASATGRFDEEQLFYLQARGIPEEEARRLVVRGFLAEIVQKIGSTELEDRLTRAIESALTPSDAGDTTEEARG